MTRYHGGETVGAGAYFNATELSFKVLSDDGVLPGSAADEYRTVPTVALLVVGPVLGLAYAIFLPFIGLAMVTWAALEKAGQALAAVARVVRPAWQPAMSFLARGKRGKAAARADSWSAAAKKAADDDEPR